MTHPRKTMGFDLIRSIQQQPKQLFFSLPSNATGAQGLSKAGSFRSKQVPARRSGGAAKLTENKIKWTSKSRSLIYVRTHNKTHCQPGERGFFLSVKSGLSLPGAQGFEAKTRTELRLRAAPHYDAVMSLGAARRQPTKRAREHPQCVRARIKDNVK